ncbi:hypothetical protein AURDEDRAFT_173205 [Auricularia subglabra TFB-10046 SS5]|uniref:BTB domain-containing protein n=1 Tax=Auricularia subglabra (strain TFB-10046 / SS5) TaxID=717982 RepID=J0DB20_AURST|nr:hypothetical protein AURDEDRAFT_173205 [Auricularia subglabra TFB-10046 SS5]
MIRGVYASSLRICGCRKCSIPRPQTVKDVCQQLEASRLPRPRLDSSRPTMTLSITANEPRFHTDFAAGDVEIITSTGVRFRTQAAILCRTSGFFASLFAHAQAEASAPPGEPAQITVDEDAKTIAILLKIASGLPFLTETSGLGLQGMERLALSAEKYEISGALDVVRLSLRTKRPNLPESAMLRYALASRFNWVDLAEEAARETLDIALDYDALPYMDMRHLARLLSLRQRRIDTFTQVITSLSGPFALENNGNCRHSSKSHPAGDGTAAWTMLRASLLVKMWSRPSASSIFEDDEAVEALCDAKCRVHGLHIYDWDKLKGKLTILVDRLPVNLC